MLFLEQTPKIWNSGVWPIYLSLWIDLIEIIATPIKRLLIEPWVEYGKITRVLSTCRIRKYELSFQKLVWNTPKFRDTIILVFKSYPEHKLSALNY